MQPLRGPKIQYRAITGRLTIELDQASVLALNTIQTALQRASDMPTVPVSKSVATRRALCTYADALSRQTEGSLLAEAGRAFAGTYIDKRRPKTITRDRKF